MKVQILISYFLLFCIGQTGYDVVTADYCIDSYDVDGRNGCDSDDQCFKNGRKICDTDPDCFGISWHKFDRKVSWQRQRLKICKSRDIETSGNGRTMLKRGINIAFFSQIIPLNVLC